MLKCDYASQMNGIETPFYTNYLVSIVSIVLTYRTVRSYTVEYRLLVQRSSKVQALLVEYSKEFMLENSTVHSGFAECIFGQRKE